MANRKKINHFHKLLLFDMGQHGKAESGVVIVESKTGQLVEKLADIALLPTFIIAYVSPYLDIDQIGEMITSRFPGVPLTLCSTAGEIHATPGKLYCETGSYWDRIIVQCFDSSIISQAEVVSVHLGSEDLRRGTVEVTLEERIKRIKESILELQIPMDIRHHDTLAYILFDGLSLSESFFMEALYASARFPCLFVGGSAGGKLNFQKTWLHDGHKKLENHALIAFLKVAPGVRFGIMKSQNFIPTGTSFSILSASVEYRYVSQVIDNKGHIISLIDGLCDVFHCLPSELKDHMQEYSFAIPVGEELFIRSIQKFDIESDHIHFYCDISPGEELLLVRKGPLAESTRNDFERFMQGKPSEPIAGILNDCIQRRLLNKSELSDMPDILSGTAIAGFSTYGEILGLNLNQTLTAIFFFRIPQGFKFEDDYVDNFPIYYGEFKAFFLKRQISKLKGLSHIIVRQIEDFKQHQYGSRLQSSGMEPTMMTVFDGLNDLGQALSEADTQRRLEARQVEQQLRESEERFRLLAESSLAGIYHLENCRFNYVNGAFAHMFGYTVDEILGGLLIDDLIDPDDREMVIENIRQREAGERHTIRYSFRALRKNGSTFYVEVHGRRIKHRGTIGIIGTLIDITEQKRAEASLRASEERYRVFFNETPSMFFTVNDKGVITAVNDFGARQLGYNKNELEGNYYLNLFHKDDTEAVSDRISNSLQTLGQTFQWQYRKIRKDGSLMWSEEFVRTVHDQEGKVNLLVVSQDITERKQLEESLRLTQFIFDKASVGIFLTTDNGAVIDANEHACRSLGYSKEELRNLTVADWDPNFDRDTLNRLTEQLNKIPSKTFETTHRRKNGEIFPVQIFVNSLPYADKPLRVSFAHDISEWKQAEIAQQHLESQLKQIQKLEAIGRLAGGIAHDLNNLLTPVLGYAELLCLDPSIDNKAKDKLSQINKAAIGAKDLVKQLLAFSRKQVLEYQALNVNHVLSDFEKLIRRTVRENIDIIIYTSDDIMPILADQGQIQQVLLNLVVNASDAMPQGGRLGIETRMTELDRTYAESHPDVIPGLYVMLEISDTGSGMSETTMPNIFEPFFSTKGDKGTGLGLATVYGIVKQHNGSIQVSSEPGQGTTFRIYLPATDKMPHKETPLKKQRINISGTESLLLVEDNEAVRTTVKDILLEKGYQVITAANGEEALGMISKDSKLDMLITDVVMSGMNGKELFSRVTALCPTLKVLYISGYTDDIFEYREVADEQLFFLQKPFSSLTILQKVREILDS